MINFILCMFLPQLKIKKEIRPQGENLFWFWFKKYIYITKTRRQFHRTARWFPQEPSKRVWNGGHVIGIRIEQLYLKWLSRSIRCLKKKVLPGQIFHFWKSQCPLVVENSEKSCREIKEKKKKTFNLCKPAFPNLLAKEFFFVCNNSYYLKCPYSSTTLFSKCWYSISKLIC